jgi:peptide/nickel transport system permease protein
VTVGYIVRRFLIFLVIIWAAGTFNFFLPRLGGGDPVRQKLTSQMALGSAQQQGFDEMVRTYNEKFGLDKPLPEQYVTYMLGVLHLDFGTSISAYPRKVVDMVREAIPWTIGLLVTTTILGFLIGNLLGAFMAWPRAPKFLAFVMPPLLMLGAIPYFLFGLILVYVFGFALGIFPMFGGYTSGTIPSLTLDSILDVLWHSILPALSIILVSTGGWAVGMRALFLMTRGEDYVIFAEAKGVKDWSLFFRYSIRNALLPQITALAIALGHVVSGAVLVEVIFGYPGIGTVLYQGIRGTDYFLVQGIVFVIIVSIGIATLTLDIIYPLLDPRITYRRA